MKYKVLLFSDAFDETFTRFLSGSNTIPLFLFGYYLVIDFSPLFTRNSTTAWNPFTYCTDSFIILIYLTFTKLFAELLTN